MAIGMPQTTDTVDPNSPIRFYSPERAVQMAGGTMSGDQSSVNRASQSWALESDPVYQQALAGGQSAFNRSRANALADVQNQTTSANRQLTTMKQNAQGARRNLAGNFAARGMGRGAYGAYYRAQDQANAADIAAQTSVKDQLAALNQNFLANYGAVGTDWTGTSIGQDYRNQAIQQAIAAQLARYGV